jgi:antitoxin HicB
MRLGTHLVDRTWAVKEINVKAIYKLPLVMEPQPEGGYTVTCPLLPELITEGDSVQEAVANASDALAAIIEAFQDLGRPLPAVLQPTAMNAPIWVETAVAVA